MGKGGGKKRAEEVVVDNPLGESDSDSEDEGKGSGGGGGGGGGNMPVRTAPPHSALRPHS